MTSGVMTAEDFSDTFVNTHYDLWIQKNRKCLTSQAFPAVQQQGMRESNSHQRFWRPLSYHLTNPLYNLFLNTEYFFIIPAAVFLVKRRWRDLNPRTGCPAYRISSADPSATWVHLRVNRLYYICLEGKGQFFFSLLAIDVKRNL